METTKMITLHNYKNHRLVFYSLEKARKKLALIEQDKKINPKLDQLYKKENYNIKIKDDNNSVPTGRTVKVKLSEDYSD